VTAPKKSNGTIIKIAIVVAVALLGFITTNTVAHSNLNDRVHDNEAVRRETDAEIKGALKALRERSERIEKKIDRLLEK